MLSRTRRVLLSGLLVAGGLGVGPAGGSLPSIGAIATRLPKPATAAVSGLVTGSRPTVTPGSGGTSAPGATSARATGLRAGAPGFSPGVKARAGRAAKARAVP